MGSLDMFSDKDVEVLKTTEGDIEGSDGIELLNGISGLSHEGSQNIL